MHKEGEMEISESKIALAYIISESSLGKSDKLNMLDFIKDLDSEIAEQLINIDEIEVKRLLGTAILISTAYSLGRLTHNRYMSQAASSCKGKSGDDKSACIRLYKERGMKGRLDALRKESTKCNQTDDMAKCRKTFTDAIRKVEAEIRKLR